MEILGDRELGMHRKVIKNKCPNFFIFIIKLYLYNIEVWFAKFLYLVIFFNYELIISSMIFLIYVKIPERMLWSYFVCNQMTE